MHKIKKHKVKAKKEINTFMKNVAIFFSAFFVLYLFFILAFGNFCGNENITTYYALSSENFKDEYQSYAEADKIKLMGGGGNVWHNEDKYQVIAFVYDSADSASSVQNRLANEDVSLSIAKIEIDMRKLPEEDKIYISQILDISNRVYGMSISMADIKSASQTTIMLEEIKKSLTAAAVRAELLATSSDTAEIIKILSTQTSDAFNQVLAKDEITMQELSWLRTQILIFANEFVKNY